MKFGFNHSGYRPKFPVKHKNMNKDIDLILIRKINTIFNVYKRKWTLVFQVMMKFVDNLLPLVSFSFRNKE